MIDEYKARADLDRATRADVLLRDELLVEAFEGLERLYIEHWKDSLALDAPGRERLWQAVQIVGKVRSHLKNVIANGTLAAADLKNLTS